MDPNRMLYISSNLFVAEKTTTPLSMPNSTSSPGMLTNLTRPLEDTWYLAIDALDWTVFFPLRKCGRYLPYLANG